MKFRLVTHIVIFELPEANSAISEISSRFANPHDYLHYYDNVTMWEFYAL